MGWNKVFFVWSTNKMENSEYKSSLSLWSKKFQVNRDKGKVVLEVFFFDCQGTVHCDFIPEGKTVNKEMYLDILRHFRDIVRKKCPPKLRTNSWCLLHDNSPSHWSVLVKNFLAKNTVTTLEHPLYSLTWLQLIFTCSLNWNQTWRDGASVMLLTFKHAMTQWRTQEFFSGGV